MSDKNPHPLVRKMLNDRGRKGEQPMKSEGFTLIELVTIAAIIGILMVVGIPAVKSFRQSTEARSVERQIIADLWFARHRAIATGEPHTVKFYSQDGSNYYVIFRDDGGGVPSLRGNGELDSGETVLATKHLDNTYQFTEINLDPDRTVTFMPRGMLKRGTTGGTITIGSDKGDVRTVFIRPSGHCRAGQG